MLGGQDFQSTEDTLSFPAGSDVGDVECFKIPLRNDRAFEKLEYFYVYVTRLEDNVFVHERYAEVHIYDDDRKSKKHIHLLPRQ